MASRPHYADGVRCPDCGAEASADSDGEAFILNHEAGCTTVALIPLVVEPKPLSAPQRNTKYDAGARRRGQRRGRERGCWVYVPAEELRKAGHDPQDAPPWYRVWGSARGGVMVRLYRKP